MGLQPDTDTTANIQAGGHVHGQRIFPHAMVSAGVLHIIHGLTLGAHEAMACWSTFLGGLRLVVKLLGFKLNRE
eukprot:8309602-Alexandrium_andersonii.AAC.1